jgi:Fanconi anemia group M protein
MEIIPREYQKKIAEQIIEKGNTLVVLPTGLGKTLIGALVIDHFLKKGKRCMFLAPTRPLVDQHSKKIREYLGIEPTVITGEMHQRDRLHVYQDEKTKVVIATPQTVNNDLSESEVFAGYGCVIVDECHRSVGKYAYTNVAKHAKANNLLIIGLTASPGGKAERIQQIMDSLFIDHVEIRTDEQKDVKQYVQPLDIEWVYVDLSKELQDGIGLLNQLMDEKAQTLSSLNIAVTRKLSRARLSQIYHSLIQHKYFAALGHFAVFYNAFHGNELLETEGPYAFNQFVERLKERKKNVDWRILKVQKTVEGLEHPKMAVLLSKLNELKGKKTLIFAQYRDQVNHIVDVLTQNNLSAKRFLGKKAGSQREQKETLEEFAADKFDVLVASSIGEEGIHIPAVDTAIFYEPVPSEIRSIQRRGRVGRTKEGKVIILVAKDTRDETFRWVAAAREKRMHSIIKGIKSGKIKRKKKEQPTITDYLQ